MEEAIVELSHGGVDLCGIFWSLQLSCEDRHHVVSKGSIASSKGTT
jgi:hypothetical protein